MIFSANNVVMTSLRLKINITLLQNDQFVNLVIEYLKKDLKFLKEENKAKYFPLTFSSPYQIYKVFSYTL